MVWNQKIAFRVFLAILISVFILIFYFVFLSDNNRGVERFFETIGFKSAENAEDSPAVPLPSGSSNSGGASSGGSFGIGDSGTVSEGEVLRFCTFDAFHVITSEVPCRCGISAVCYQSEGVCDATFNNGEGICS
ncbi:MAG: hypothetical protein AABX23_03265 [Nanoarchaeota archaeon]